MRGRDLLSLLGGALGDPYFDLEVWDAWGPSTLTLDERDALAELADPTQTVFVAPTVRDGADGEPVAWCLTADLDGVSARGALTRHGVPPTAVHEYGDGTALALWSLRSSLEGDDLARANRCLAGTLGMAQTLLHGALLRAPAAAPEICDPPKAVHSCGHVFDLRDVVEIGSDHTARTNARRVAALALKRGDDPLREIPTATYVRVLAEVEAPTCPLHAGAEPTLHVEEIAGTRTGFYCSVCEREGTIYDFAAHLWGWTFPGNLTGARFYALQRHLLSVFARHYGEAAA